MAASSQDKLMEVGIATATTLDANYTINDTSITVASTSGWPTATGVAFAIDVVDSAGVQVPGTYNEYVGVVSSATSITSVDHVNGTDRNYSAGATTRVYIPVSAERENRIVEWGTVQHKQDGTHADTITTDTINENTSANGVTIDGLNIKDSKLNTNDSVVTANITDGAVTPAKLANPYRFAAHRSTAINTTPTTTTVLPCATELYDPNNNYDTTTFRYTAPVDGIYHFEGAIMSGGAATSRLFLTIYKNGTEVTRGDDRSVSSFAATINKDMLLSATDYVDIRYYAADTIPMATTNQNTYFSGHCVVET